MTRRKGRLKDKTSFLLREYEFDEMDIEEVMKFMRQMKDHYVERYAYEPASVEFFIIRKGKKLAAELILWDLVKIDDFKWKDDYLGLSDE